jgi:hypothetical protein
VAYFADRLLPHRGPFLARTAVAKSVWRRRNGEPANPDACAAASSRGKCGTYHAPGGFGTGHGVPDNSLIYVRRPVVPAVLENQGAEMTGSDI